MGLPRFFCCKVKHTMCGCKVKHTMCGCKVKHTMCGCKVKHTVCVRLIFDQLQEGQWARIHHFLNVVVPHFILGKMLFHWIVAV